MKVIPMADEPALAHFARWQTLSGARDCGSRRDLDDLRDALDISDPVSVTPRLHLLAKLAAMDAVEYAQKHSMLGLTRLAAPLGQAPDHGTPESATFSNRVGMQLHRKGIFVCVECIRADLASPYRTSWFRRVHHVRGLERCPVHGSTLCRIDAERPLQDLPHDWLDRGRISPVQVGGAREDDFTQRYASIAVALLSRPRPVICHTLNSILAARLRIVSRGGQSPGKQPGLMSDAVAAAADRGWLERHFPEFLAKEQGKRLALLDSIATYFKHTARGDAYLLALATLYETTQDALDAVVQADQLGREMAGEDRPKRARRLVRGDAFWNGDIWEIYLQHGGNIDAIARHLQIAAWNLNHKMREAGLPSLRGFASQARWDAFLRFSQGAPLQAACEQAKADALEVENLLRKCSTRAAAALKRINVPREASAPKEGEID